MGFAILFSIAFAFMFCENYAFWNIEDTTVENFGKGNVKLYDIFRIPLKDKEFMGYTIKLVVFYLALYFSASYAQVYMIRYLELPYTFISSMAVMDAVIQIFIYTKLGTFNSRYDIMPEKGRNLYEGFYTAAIGLTLLVAPWVGGQFKGALAQSAFITHNLEFGEFRIIFAISAVGIAALQIFGAMRRYRK